MTTVINSNRLMVRRPYWKVDPLEAATSALCHFVQTSDGAFCTWFLDEVDLPGRMRENTAMMGIQSFRIAKSLDQGPTIRVSDFRPETGGISAGAEKPYGPLRETAYEIYAPILFYPNTTDADMANIAQDRWEGSISPLCTTFIPGKWGTSERKKRIDFVQEFDVPPNVVVWINSMTWETRGGVVFYVEPRDIDTTGFTMVFRHDLESGIMQLEMSWIAFPVDDPDVCSGKMGDPSYAEYNTGNTVFYPIGHQTRNKWVQAGLTGLSLTKDDMANGIDVQLKLCDLGRYSFGYQNSGGRVWHSYIAIDVPDQVEVKKSALKKPRKNAPKKVGSARVHW